VRSYLLRGLRKLKKFGTDEEERKPRLHLPEAGKKEDSEVWNNAKSHYLNVSLPLPKKKGNKKGPLKTPSGQKSEDHPDEKKPYNPCGG